LIKDCEVLSDKVLVNGQVLINILYEADMEGKPMHSMDISANLSQAIEMPGAKAKMKEFANAVVQHVECSIINSRKLNMRVIMDIGCRVEELFDLELASDVRGLSDIQILREPCKMKQVVSYNKDQYNINEQLVVLPEKPAVHKILKTDFRAMLKEDKITDGKVELSGVLGINVLYVALNEESSIDFLEFEVPFNQYIEVPAADRSMDCVTEVNPGQFYIEAVENEVGEKKLLTVEAVINVNTKVYKDAEEEAVADAYSPSNVIEVGKEMVKMNEFVGKGRSNTVVKESISIRHGDPEIENVCYVNAIPVINETKILDDKVMIEGVLEADAIYMSSFSGEPTCSLREQIPFRHFVDIPGLKLGMQCITKCNVESLTFSPMNSQMIEMRVVICVSADAYKQTDKKLVNRVEEVDGIAIDQSRIPAVTIYLVQKGDTLWSIAKRYNTTVDALVKLNNIENPSRVATGMQVMILKNVRAGKAK
jgi:nucleoid-associated protein YgaU